MTPTPGDLSIWRKSDERKFLHSPQRDIRVFSGTIDPKDFQRLEREALA